MSKIADTKREQAQTDTDAERNDMTPSSAVSATANAVADTSRETAQVVRNASDAVEDRYETARHLAEKSTGFGRAFAELLEEQTRHTADTIGAVARAESWMDVAQAQGKLVVDSVSRLSQFNVRQSQNLFRGMKAMPKSIQR